MVTKNLKKTLSKRSSTLLVFLMPFDILFAMSMARMPPGCATVSVSAFRAAVVGDTRDACPRACAAVGASAHMGQAGRTRRPSCSGRAAAGLFTVETRRSRFA